jgi:hypothetical protein
MAEKSETKKWSLGEENGVFQEQQTQKWCFVMNKGRSACVICKQTVRVPEE